VLAAPVAHCQARIKATGPQTHLLDPLIDRIVRDQRGLGVT